MGRAELQHWPLRKTDRRVSPRPCAAPAPTQAPGPPLDLEMLKHRAESTLLGSHDSYLHFEMRLQRAQRSPPVFHSRWQWRPRKDHGNQKATCHWGRPHPELP